MEEHGHITFLKERYEFKVCKAAFFPNNVQFECEGPDIFFSFYKLRIRDALVHQTVFPMPPRRELAQSS